TVIKEVKETLRRVPHKGVGYGVRRYLQGKRGKVQPGISFNYLGQLDGFRSKELQLSDFPMGNQIQPSNHQECDLYLHGVILKGCLQLRLFANGEAYETKTVQKLLSIIKQCLERLVQHCLTQNETEHTPSDYGMKDWSLDDLEDLLDVFEDE
ncbi:condensation domain-containing protein, partial [Kroppenstedtia guangzhouensis]|uniref:condensation domain-containing protein n=1 Tax=Kroppenstedtia guangzhouensis TaxID=1274356 RepID=UPI001E4DB455